MFPEKLENTKGVIRSLKSHEGKYNGKNDKRSNNNLELFPLFVVHTFLISSHIYCVCDLVSDV